MRQTGRTATGHELARRPLRCRLTHVLGTIALLSLPLIPAPTEQPPTQVTTHGNELPRIALGTAEPTPFLRRSVQSQVDEPSRTRVTNLYAQLPLSFEANHGQFDSEVRFLSRGVGYTLFLTSTEAVLALRKPASAPAYNQNGTADQQAADESQNPKTSRAVIRMQLLGSNPMSKAGGVDKLGGMTNYFIGNDPKKWRTNMPNYTRVRYQDVYPGIDLVYYGTNQRQLEYDFIVAPGADPRVIRLGFTGADELVSATDGSLLLRTRGGELQLRAPVVFQEIEGSRHRMGARFDILTDHQIGFTIDNYDTTKPLIIDPVLRYSTYLGGSGSDTGLAIAVDSSGNAYVTGITLSTNFPTANAYDNSFNNNPSISPFFQKYDVFVTKINAEGSALVYSTYLGGKDEDRGRAIAVDSSGNAYLTVRINRGRLTRSPIFVEHLREKTRERVRRPRFSPPVSADPASCPDRLAGFFRTLEGSLSSRPLLQASFISTSAGSLF